MSEITVADYLNQLIADKATMVSNLQAKGVQVTGDETFTELAPAIVTISTAKEIVVEFYDYDGTVVYSYSKDEALALTALPAGPTHQGFIFDGWNWTLEEIKDYVTRYEHTEVIVGSLFKTTTGATKMTVELLDDTLTPEIQINPNSNNTITIDWGDGTTPDTYTQSSAIVADHTYSAAGTYDILIDGTRSYTFTGNSNCTPSFFGAAGIASQTSNKYKAKNRRYWECLKFLALGTRAKVTGTTLMLTYFTAKYVVFSADTALSTTGGLNAFFAGAIFLKYACFPRTITIYGQNLFNQCQDIIVALPGNTTKYAVNATGSGSVTYKKLTLPDSLTEVDMATTNRGLKRMIIPRNITGQTFIPADVEELHIYNEITSGQKSILYIKFSTGSRNSLKILKYHNDVSKLKVLNGNMAGIDFDNLDTNIDITKFTDLPDTYVFAYATKKVFDLRNVINGWKASYWFYYANTTEIILNTNMSLSAPSDSSQLAGQCYMLQKITLPNVTELTSGAVSGTAIRYLKIPASVTTIASGAISNNYCLEVMDFRDHTAIPSMLTSYSGSSFPLIRYIVVPDDLYASWVNAGGSWNTWTSYLIKASEYDAL